MNGEDGGNATVSSPFSTNTFSWYTYLKKRSYLIKITSSTLHKYAHLFFFATKGAARYIQWALWKKKTSFSVCNVWEIHHRKSVSPPQAKNPKLPAVCLRRSRGPSVPSFFFFSLQKMEVFFFLLTKILDFRCMRITLVNVVLRKRKKICER